MIDLKVQYGKRKIFLNHHLIAEKCLTDDQVQTIKDLHIARMKIEIWMERCKKPEKILWWFATWTENQYLLQEAWGFEQNANWHPSHRLPHCVCGFIDNEDRLGTPYKVVNPDCILHGEKNATNED